MVRHIAASRFLGCNGRFGSGRSQIFTTGNAAQEPKRGHFPVSQVERRLCRSQPGERLQWSNNPNFRTWAQRGCPVWRNGCHKPDHRTLVANGWYGAGRSQTATTAVYQLEPEKFLHSKHSQLNVAGSSQFRQSRRTVPAPFSMAFAPRRADSQLLCFIELRFAHAMLDKIGCPQQSLSL